jgi:hypothetical protein
MRQVKKKENKMPSYKQEEPKSAGIFLVPPGKYEVEIVKATEKTSQSGNAMIKLECEIILGPDKKGPVCWDFLVFTPKASWKIDQFLASIGRKVVAGENVEVEALDLIGKLGVVEVGEEDGSTNPDQKFNNIERWIFGDEQAKWRAPKADAHIVAKSNGYAPTPDETDDIPF